MKRRAAMLATALALTVGGGGVVASALMDAPQEATPAAQSPSQPDPIADLLRRTPATPPPAQAAPDPAPSQTSAPAQTAAASTADAEGEEEVTEAVIEDARTPAGAVSEPERPAPRQRRRMVIVQAVDKITAESMRFEVEVGGRPVRFKQALIFTARACEVSPPEERSREAAAYLEISLQPRGAAAGTETRSLFNGWMFASSPGVNGLEHAVYDAWVVGCTNG